SRGGGARGPRRRGGATGARPASRGTGPPLAGGEHRLAEYLSRSDARDDLLPVHDVDRARDDQVEGVGLVAGLVDHRSLGKRDLSEETGDLLSLDLPEATERGQREEALLAARAQHGGGPPRHP